MQPLTRLESRVGVVVDGKWRIERLLGHGATSAVYEAHHRNGNRAALKILHPSLCNDPEIVERFLREAYLANSVQHPAIVAVRDDGMLDGALYLVLDLLDGETLEEMRERRGGRLPLEEVAPIMDAVMEAIAGIHKAGVFHRDLKPQNVFIQKTGKVKILDFGSAVAKSGHGARRLSVEGLVLGTPSFMSPEQARGERDAIDAQSDVWALGAMLFTMLSGEFVHDAKDPHARLLAAAMRRARSFAIVAPDFPERIVTVIDRALMARKDERWPDVELLREAFKNAALAANPNIVYPDPKAHVFVEEVEDTRDAALVGVPPAYLADPDPPAGPSSTTLLSISKMRAAASTSEPPKTSSSKPPAEDPLAKTASLDVLAAHAVADGARTDDVATPAAAVPGDEKNPDDPDKTEVMTRDAMFSSEPPPASSNADAVEVAETAAPDQLKVETPLDAVTIPAAPTSSVPPASHSEEELDRPRKKKKRSRLPLFALAAGAGAGLLITLAILGLNSQEEKKIADARQRANVNATAVAANANKISPTAPSPPDSAKLVSISPPAVDTAVAVPKSAAPSAKPPPPSPPAPPAPSATTSAARPTSPPTAPTTAPTTAKTSAPPATTSAADAGTNGIVRNWDEVEPPQ